MSKVVTSEGLQDFISTGKPTETVPNDPKARKEALNAKLAAADAPEIEPAKALVEMKVGEEPVKEAPKVEETGLEPEDHDLAERAKRRIGKKHYEMKLAQEAALAAKEEVAEAERFAENLFNERESWKKRAEEAETAKKALEAQVKPSVPEVKKPDPNAFMDENRQFKAFEYAEALAEYSAKKAVADDRQEQAAARQKLESDAAAAAFKARMEEATKKTPDWKEVVQGSDITLQNECLQYISQSEYGTDLAYYLAKNKAVAEKIRAMHPIRAIAELGKIETSFEKPAIPTAEKTQAVIPPATSRTERQGAPAPITPITTLGTAAVVVDPAKMDFKQLRAYERERRLEKSRR